MQTITYNQIKTMKVNDLEKCVPFCFVNSIGVQVRIEQFCKKVRRFKVQTFSINPVYMTIGDIKETILVPQTTTKVETKTIANYSIDEVQTQIEKLNTLREKRLKEIQTIDNDIAMLLQKQAQLKNQYSVKRITPSMAKELTENELDNIYTSNVLSNYCPDSSKKCKVYGISMDGKRFIDNVLGRYTELYVITSK